MRVRFSGSVEASELAGKVIEFSSLEKDALGSLHIAFQDHALTDTRGEVEFSVKVNRLWQTASPPSEIRIAARWRDDPQVVASLGILIIDNAAAILDHYLQRIPKGRIWDNQVWDEAQASCASLVNIQKWMLMRSSMAGHINNAFDSVLFDWMPNHWNDQFGEFTCGGYQAKVLNLLSDLHFNGIAGAGQTDFLFNGLDYGPLFENGGIHVAAMLYPRQSDGHWEWLEEDTWILDPWLEQEARFYRWSQWLDRLYDKNLLGALGGASKLNVAPWSSLLEISGAGQVYNYSYPANGGDYPSNRLRPVVTHSTEFNQVLMVNCPVAVTLQDEQGRKCGYYAGVAQGKNPVVDEIPNMRRSLIALPDGTSSWFFELPGGNFTVSIQSYANSMVDVAILGSYHSLRYEAVSIAPMETGLLNLSQGSVQDPLLQLGDNRIVQPVRAAGPAFLRATRSGGAVVLSWPSDFAGYRLQFTPNLLAPVWRDWTSTNNPVSTPLTSPQRFFRLAK